jgi:hypothetical protein
MANDLAAVLCDVDDFCLESGPECLSPPLTSMESGFGICVIGSDCKLRMRTGPHVIHRVLKLN